VDCRQADDVELSSTSDGEIRPEMDNVSLAPCDAVLLTATLTDNALVTEAALDDEQTAMLAL